MTKGLSLSSAIPAQAPAPRRRGLWAAPLVLSLLFVLGVVLWAQRNEREEREELRRSLISDALSVEAQLRTRIDLEQALLRALAAQLVTAPRTVATLENSPHVTAGFRRLWVSLTWLDKRNRIVAHVQSGAIAHELHLGSVDDPDARGLSSHLVAPVSAGGHAADTEAHFAPDVDGEKLVARYLPAMLLKRGTPWWIAHKYDVRLVDVSDHVLAALEQPGVSGARDLSYRVLVGQGLPGTYLELTLRQLPKSWVGSLPLVLMAGFLLLIVGATALLRQRVRQVLQAEAAWRTEAAWRGAMEDSALVGLRARDAQGRLIYVNRTFCEMVGRPAEELIGRAPPMPYWPSDSLEEAEQRSRRNLAGLAPREGYEAHWVHADGHRVDVMVFESPLVDAGGRQIGWMGSMIDITQRKQLEERERHQAEAMAHQARLTTLGEVASALAHQLNQPLTVIASYNSGVLRMLERAGFADETVLNALRRQGEQVAEAGRIVQRIRSFLTRRAPQRERCDLAVTLHRAVKLLQRDLRQQPVRIEWELPADLPEVLADAVLIEQVTLNLVRNAIDAAQGEQQAPLQLRIQALAEPAQRHVCVCVDDNGPGLQGRSIETLTAPFYSTKTEGMGMGLAICRSVIEAHRGRLDASASAVLGGACFSFTLPIWNEP
ncbi:MAG: hypothetical protein RJA44_2086 [Pseudomonadota bacterium]